MRFARRLAVVGALLAGVVVLAAGPASAHPLGNFTINLYSGLVVEPGQLRVNYVLDMAEIPTYEELSLVDANHDGTASPAERSAYARRKAAELVRGVTATQGGRVVALDVVSSAMLFRPGQAGLPIMRLTAVFAGHLSGPAGSLRYDEGNYGDRIGWREITAIGASGEVVRGSSVPARSVSDTLLRYPKALLSSPLHVTRAALSFRPGSSGAAPVLPSGGGGGARPLVAGGPFAKLATWSGLSAPILLLALVLALGFGALHALLPGHGKTIMAAYLVGAGGRLRQAVAVGVAVAFMHSASVIGLGAVILSAERVFAPERVYPWLTLGSGLVVLALGGALLVGRVRSARRASAARATLAATAPVEVPDRRLVLVASGGAAIEQTPSSVPHLHDWGDHEHGHVHPLPDPDRPLSRKSLAALAVAGGILPSPTALVVLLSTATAHRIAFGLSLIVAFSLGLAGALVAVGAFALRARELVRRRLHGGLAGALPIISAAVIVGVGLYLMGKAAGQL